MRPAWYPIPVRRVRVVVPAPFRFRVAADTLSFTARFRSPRPPEDLHLLQTKHAWQTKTPIALRGRRSVTANIDRLEELLLPDGTRREKVAVATENSEGLTGFLRRSTLDAYATADQLSKLGVEDKSSTSRPDSELARRLQVIARLIKTDFKTRVYYTTQSGYDTHIEQLPTHARLMRELSGALLRFFEDLRAAKLDERVVVLCFSEFGRRVKENASKGTDHGTAGPVLLVGPSVEPGLHGTMPSMLDLEEGDLKYTVDFRRVYATILKSWMGVEVGLTIFGDFETLSLFRS